MIDQLEDAKLDKLFNEIVRHLVDGHAPDAADGLAQLATYYAKAGLPQELFFGMRQHLLESATSKAGCAMFVHEKLKEAERYLCEKRTGTTPSTIIIH